jgi:hypothetical protein
MLGLVQTGPQVAAVRYTSLATLGWSVLSGGLFVAGTARARRLLPAAMGALLLERLSNLGLLLAHSGRPAEGITQLHAALAVSPDLLFIHMKVPRFVQGCMEWRGRQQRCATENADAEVLQTFFACHALGLW